jgi:arylformamidase
MPMIDLEAEYNNRARVPEHPAIIAGWARDAQAYRSEVTDARRTLVPYGDSPRQTLELFSPKAPDHGPAVLFIHGGYWQGLDPSFFSHMARGLNERGIRAAIAGYDLCPDVTLGAITEQLIRATERLFRLTNRPVIVAGHSAGGHLAACLAATDWEEINPAYPAHVVPTALAISGLFELEPLVPTSINIKLGLDIASARALSPRLWMPPQGLIFDAWVGADESAEYHRQSQGIAAVWGAAGNDTRYVPVAGANHFTVISGLSEPASALTARLVEYASQLK